MKGELKLSVKCLNFRSSHEFDNDKEFDEVKDFIKDRDGRACVHCGDSFEKYMEVHHIDDDHNNNDQNNLATVCSLCHACHHIGLAGKNGRGVIAYVPEMTQVEINRAYRLLMCIGSDGVSHPFSQYYVRADGWVVRKAAFDDSTGVRAGNFIQNRIDIVEDHFCQNWSDPAFLGDMLKSLSSNEYDKRSEFLDGLRLIPVIHGYSDHISYWSSQVAKKYPLSEWESLVKKAAGII